MRLPVDTTAYFFVDEAGDPVFFNKHGECIVGQAGCSRVLILGFAMMADPIPVRRALAKLRAEVASDPYFSGIPSISKTTRAFHANDDVPEVRERVYRLIAGLDIGVEVVVARKILP